MFTSTCKAEVRQGYYQAGKNLHHNSLHAWIIYNRGVSNQAKSATRFINLKIFKDFGDFLRFSRFIEILRDFKDFLRFLKIFKIF